MRPLPPRIAVPSESATPAANHVVESLADRLKRQAVSNDGNATVKPEPEKEEKAEEQQKNAARDPESDEQESAEEETDSATFDEFKEEAEKKFSELLENPEEFSEMILQFGNLGRIVFLPGIYEGLMYPGQERNDIRDVVRRAIENEKANREPTFEFNAYDTRLYMKWPKLQEAIQNVSYTEPEMKAFARIIAKRIKSMPLAVWMEKYDWVIYFLYLEFKHAKNMATMRATDFVAKKFGL